MRCYDSIIIEKKKDDVIFILRDPVIKHLLLSVDADETAKILIYLNGAYTGRDPQIAYYFDQTTGTFEDGAISVESISKHIKSLGFIKYGKNGEPKKRHVRDKIVSCIFTDIYDDPNWIRIGNLFERPIGVVDTLSVEKEKGEK